jgi:eukaryotic-like serine/threonine-protein kinase
MDLRKGKIVTSFTTGRRYRVGEPLGRGGYGRVYHAFRLSKNNRRMEEVCLKTTRDAASWHREAYFGELLGFSRRVIHLHDSFPLALRQGGRNKMLYCLVLELARHGTVADYLERTGKPWPEVRVRREMIALLKVIDQLHGGSATHRDLTPLNIFVCDQGRLKLGDFGIARHQLAGRPAEVEAFASTFVSARVKTGRRRIWAAVDDVFQMGQLMAMLLRGEAHEQLTGVMINRLDCSVEAKTIIKRAAGVRHRRYADAFELLQALRNEASDAGPPRTIQGRTVAFAGPLSEGHAKAEIVVLAAGGLVADRVTPEVDFVVHGGRLMGYSSAKLQQAAKLVRAGHPIKIISEAELRRFIREERPHRAAAPADDRG